jgi:hypothetical protein
MVTTAVALESSRNAHAVDSQKDEWAPPVLLRILGFTS